MNWLVNLHLPVIHESTIIQDSHDLIGIDLAGMKA